MAYKSKTNMSWAASFLIAFITGVFGVVVSGVVADAYTNWYHIPSRDGTASYLVVAIAVLGGLVSSLLGLIIANVVAWNANPSFLKAAIISWVAVLLVNGFVALVLYLFADIPPRIDGDRLRLEIEIRLPMDQQIAPNELQGDAEFVLGSVVNQTQRAFKTGELKISQLRHENGRWIVPAEVLLFTSRGLRSISARIGEESLAEFIVPLPAYPDKQYESWSDWLPKPPDGQPPWPETNSSYRFRVQRIAPPPPPPTKEEQAAWQDAIQQAAFDANLPDAPILAWLPYTGEWENPKRRDVAIERIVRREEFVSELRDLMLDPDPRHAEAALRFVGVLQNPDPALVPAVTSVGRDIIARIERVNETTPDQDPDYDGPADIAIRFSAWMVAVRALREKVEADFIVEIQEILILSRIRTDSRAMQDVRRVASYYMKTWAGVEPLPGDPPPN